MASSNPPPGSETLTNVRHERFAQIIVIHPKTSQGQCWAMAGGGGEKPNPRALRATAHKVRHRPEVAARIHFLTLEARSRAERDREDLLNAASLEQLMHRLSAVLRAVHDRGKAEGVEDAKLSRLRRTMIEHIGRLQVKLDQLRRVDGPAEDATKAPALPFSFANVGDCQCPTK